MLRLERIPVAWQRDPWRGREELLAQEVREGGTNKVRWWKVRDPSRENSNLLPPAQF